jgi:hypothetical protein
LRSLCRKAWKFESSRPHHAGFDAGAPEIVSAHLRCGGKALPKADFARHHKIDLGRGEMIWDDVRRVLLSPATYRLGTPMGRALVPLLYLFGMAAILVWSVAHMVDCFVIGWSYGIWGIIETLVYAPLMFIALRIVAELVLVRFGAAVAPIRPQTSTGTLIEEVTDAIHELAEDDDDDGIIPATEPAPFAARQRQDRSPRSPIVGAAARL